MVPPVGVDHDELVKVAEKHFSSLPSSDALPTLFPCRYTGSDMRVRDDSMPFAHIALAVEVSHSSAVVVGGGGGGGVRDDSMPFAHSALAVEVSHSSTLVVGRGSYLGSGIVGVVGRGFTTLADPVCHVLSALVGGIDHIVFE